MTDERARADDERIGRALGDLGAAIEFPPTPDLAPRVRARLAADRTPSRRSLPAAWGAVAQRPRLAWTAAFVLAMLGLILALPPAREAVAEWIGLRGVRFSEAPAVSPSAAPVDALRRSPPPFPGEALTLDEARGRVDFVVRVPAALDAPDHVLAGTPPRGGQVTLLYGPRTGLPETGTGTAALALTQFRGDVEPFIEKAIPPGARLERVSVGGVRGFWLEGAHPVFFQEPGGVVRIDDPRLAGNTLLWQRDGVTYRLESALDRDQAIRVAESLR